MNGTKKINSIQPNLEVFKQSFFIVELVFFCVCARCFFIIVIRFKYAFLHKFLWKRRWPRQRIKQMRHFISFHTFSLSRCHPCSFVLNSLVRTNKTSSYKPHDVLRSETMAKWKGEQKKNTYKDIFIAFDCWIWFESSAFAMSSYVGGADSLFAPKMSKIICRKKKLIVSSTLLWLFFYVIAFALFLYHYYYGSLFVLFWL